MSGDFGLIADNGLELHYHNVVRKGKRDGTKVERSVETRYGEIKASKNWPIFGVLSLITSSVHAATHLMDLEISYGERSSIISLRESRTASGVEKFTLGRRKIQLPTYDKRKQT